MVKMLSLKVYLLKASKTKLSASFTEPKAEIVSLSISV